MSPPPDSGASTTSAGQRPAVTAAAPRGDKEVLAPGHVLTRLGPGAGAALRLDSRCAWTGWRPRREGDAASPTFPGTAVRVGEEWYEVLRSEEQGGLLRGGVHPGRFTYHLAPWEDRFPLRDPRELSPAACLAEEARQRGEARRRQAAAGLRPVAPLVGLLPAADQEALDRELALPATGMTLRSALAELFLAMPLIGAGLAMRFLPQFAAAHPGLRWSEPWLVAWFFLLGEAVVRLLAAIAGQPCGSLPVVLVVEGWRAVRARREARTPRAAENLPLGAFAGTRDEVRGLPATTDDGPGWEIVSRLPKPHWTLHATPIRFGDTTWTAVERQEKAVDGLPRYRFVLRPYPSEVLRSPPVDYAPDEPERLHRQLVRERRAMWVGIGGSLWGLVDGAEQAALAEVFDFDPELQTRRSLLLGTVFGALGASLALGYLLTGRGNGADALVLLVSAGALVETALRHRRLQRGEIAGSVFGLPLRPLARLLVHGLRNDDAPPTGIPGSHQA